jgi:hypothetical protein
MKDANETKAGWKQKFVSELIEYWMIAVYLACFFGAFTWYRRLILAEYQISYVHYGMSLIEALVLAKVILIGDMLRLGRKYEHKPLIVPTLHKTVMFTLFVGLFGVLEHTVIGLLHGKGWAEGIEEIISTGKDELLARCLVTFFAFIPFFAFKELVRVAGSDKILMPFFRERAGSASGPSG